MKKTNPVMDKRYLPGELLYRTLLEMGESGSILKLQRFCLSENIVNPKTQSAPTRMGLWKAVYRWAYQNEQKAYEYHRDILKDKALPFDEWKAGMRQKYMTAFQNIRTAKDYYSNR
jgi:hypothetical protein